MSEPAWINVLSVDDLRTEDVIGISLAGHDIAIYSIAGEVFATSNICTHGQARLSDGFLDGYAIECPLHQGRFDVRDGRPLCAPVTQPLARYVLKIQDSRVYIRIETLA